MSVSSQTLTLAERCKVATDCLPDAPYRTQLTALHAELLVALDAQGKLAADRLAQMQADRKQALLWRDQVARQKPTDCGEACARAKLCPACSADIAGQTAPVAWRIKLCSPDLGEYVDYKGALAQIPRDSRNWTPLYATPQRVPPAPPVIEESLTTRRSWLRRNG